VVDKKGPATGAETAAQVISTGKAAVAPSRDQPVTDLNAADGKEWLQKNETQNAWSSEEHRLVGKGDKMCDKIAAGTLTLTDEIKRLKVKMPPA
jgi:hypothetical protein